MSIKKAQSIVNEIDHELGISLVAYQNGDLEYLKNKLEEFLDLDIDTSELDDADLADEVPEDDEDFEELE